jgi:CheY-like chemotaxis protein
MTNDTTVLVVDDQPQNLRLLDAVLSPRGYRVITASSGEHALNTLKVSAHRPDLAGHFDARHGWIRGLSTDSRR